MQRYTVKALRCVYIVIRHYILRASYRSVQRTITSIWLYNVSITMLVSFLVLFWLDYCNALLAGSPRVLLDKIQRVVSCSARLIFKVPKSAHITLILYDLHWLPVSSRIQKKKKKRKKREKKKSSHHLPNCFWYSSSIAL